MDTQFKSFTKYTVALLMIVIGECGFAQTTYYVSSSGDNSNNGTSSGSAWASISKVNQEMSGFSSGDQILFQRGGVYSGNLHLTTAGITISDYGTGDKPVLSGAVTFSNGWTSYSGNIWQKTLGQAPAKMNNLYREGNRLPLGRYPNYNPTDGGFLTLESSSGLSTITDNQLDNTYDWEGSDVVIKVFEYRFNRVNVTNHNGSVLTLGDGFDVPDIHDNSGYYFVNHLDALDQEGEWMYEENTSTIYLYTSSNPNGTDISYPLRDTVIFVDNIANVTISNVRVAFGNDVNIAVDGSDNLAIENVDVVSVGGEGIAVEGSDDVLVSGCYFSEVNVRSLFVRNGTTDIIIEDNEFSDIGTDPAYGKEKGLYCIYNESNGAQILRNTFERIGGGAIVTGGQNQLIKHNFVNNALMLIDDMGGIYTNNNLGGLTTAGTVIEENIVTNCLGNPQGSHYDRDWAIGIYLDNHSNNVTVRNNTIYNVGTMGCFMHMNTGTIILQGNTSMTSGTHEVYTWVRDQVSSEAQYEFEDNILVTRNTGSQTHRIFNYESDVLDVDESGTYDGNYFISPFYEEEVRTRYIDGPQTAGVYNSFELDAARPNFSNSSNSAITYAPSANQDNLLLVYNPTMEDSTISLPSGKFIDAKNSDSYCGSITLSAFTSAVLLKYSSASCATPDGTLGSLEGLNVENISGSDVEIIWNSTDNALNYDIRYKATTSSNWLYINNIKDTTWIVEDMTPLTDFECQVRASGAGVESEWVDLPGTGGAVPPIHFVNADLNNVTPGSAINSTASGTDDTWSYKTASNGTIDGNYVESYMQQGEDCPNISVVVEDSLDDSKTYDIFLYFISPESQDWQVLAKLSTQTSYTAYSRNSPNVELLNDNDGIPDRLYRVLLGEVSGTTDFQVDISDDMPGTVLRAAFDGVAYQEKPVYPINFVNANLSNINPGSAINSTSSGTDDIWTFKSASNGTIDGNYVESYMQLGEDCPDISVLVEDSLSTVNTYNIYLYFISPSSQDWQISARLAGESTYNSYSRNTPGVELLNDNDGVPDRLYRVLLGEVSGVTDFEVEISDDMSGTVLRAAFDGVAYQIKEVGSGGGGARVSDVTEILGAEQDELEIEVYPVPSNEVIYLRIPSTFNRRAKLALIDLSGKEVMERGILLDSDLQEIPLPIPKGVYLMQLTVPSENLIYRQKIIKE